MTSQELEISPTLPCTFNRRGRGTLGVLGSVLVLGSLLATRPANAADLYSEEPPAYGSAYDDPRYADLYGRNPPRRVETYRSETYREYDPAPVPRAPVYRDYPRYAERDRQGCPSKDEITRRLERDGWHGFRNPQVLDRDLATIDAQRPNGRVFRLEVNRCTGEVLAERPLDRPRYGYGGDGYGSGGYGSGPYAEYPRRPLRSY